jgi:TonB dependent receptor-like, beta-barrel
VTHGDVYDYLRDSRLNAPNALSGTRLPMSQQQYGVSLGGPVRRDRTFYFSNVEVRRLDQMGLVTIGAGSASLINARLAAVGYGGPTIAIGEYPNPVDTTHFVGKLDHQFSGHDHVTIRYSLYDVASSNARGVGGQNAPSASAGLDNRDQTIAAGNIASLTPRTVLESRAQFAYSDLAAPPTDPIGPAVNISGIAAFGTSSGSPTGRLNKTYQIVNNLSHQAGAHALRAGVDFLYNDLFITYPRSIRGSYLFSSLPNFLTGVYNNAGFTQTFGATTVEQTNPNLGIYAQDEWKARADLTINAGVRYDLQFMETIESDTNNVSPRLGFVWAPFASQRTVIRGSAGLFFDRLPLRALANALLSAGNTTDLGNLRQIGISLSPAQAGAPVFPNILPGVVPAVTLVNLTTMDRDIENAYSRQSSVEIEHQLGRSMTVSAGYQHLRGLKLIMQINQNVPSCPAAGSNNGCRPNPDYANNNQYRSDGTSVYDGLHVSLVQRPGRWGSYRVSYTYSRSMNNLGEAFFSSPIDPFDLSKDWGRSDDDQRHRLVIHGAVNTSMAPATTAWERLSHGFMLSGVIQYYSALPFNITSGVTTVQGTAARPMVDGAFIERNAGEGSAFSTVNLRLTRTFRIGRTQIEGLAEVFNLFNRRNDIARVTVFGTGAYPANPAPNFGTVTVVGDPRSWQFGARVRF